MKGAKIGMYSASAAAEIGSVFYKTPDGEEVEVTVATNDPAGYGWPNAVNVGIVTEYSRPGQTGRNPLRSASYYFPPILF